MKIIKINDKVSIGDGCSTFIIAEIGYNFNTMDEAFKSIDAAYESGVDAVKFQTFRAETITSKLTQFPDEAGSANQFEEFKQYEMDYEKHKKLFDYAKGKGLIAFSTPSYFDDVELLEKLDVPLYKLGADDLTNLPFLKYIAEKGKPIIISSGMGYVSEVDEAIRTIYSTGNKNLIVLHCVSNYPIKDLNVVNLKSVSTMKNIFDVLVGFSDHTETISVPIGSVALGACVVEKHFTLSKDLDVPDAYFSADKDEMKLIVDGIRELEKSLGNGFKTPTQTEIDMRKETRKSLIASKKIVAGEVLTEENTIIKRPGYGIEPKMSKFAYGKKIKKDINAEEVITWDFID